MIVVKVELKSAISATRDKELARFVICNDGTGGTTRRNYQCTSYRGRNAETLSLRIVNRRGSVRGHLAEREHVLNLVAKALASMGYGDGP